MELVITHDRPIVMTERQTWDPMDVRDLCIRQDWYNAGSCKDYEDLLCLVEGLEPTPHNILRVAQNIANHTRAEGAEVETIMFYIANNVVMRFFEF